MSEDRHIPEEEETLLARVKAALAARQGAMKRTVGGRSRADEELVSLRDEIGEARLEDVAALVAQMERLQGISQQRAEAQGLLIDPASPYFGHLRLRENAGGRIVERDVLIGRATFVDPERRVNIVDWRNAPISQLYYRYEEGSDYEERFGSREVEGELLARRTVTIEDGALLRVASPDGVWMRGPDGWEHSEVITAELAGGQGTAARPRKGVLGAAGNRKQRFDRHLPEIAALIDPRQFEIITARKSGVVVIQGGAGSGKTTVGLHRIAYLLHAHTDLHTPKRTLAITSGTGLAAYISQVLPSLGVFGVAVRTFKDWALCELAHAVPWLKDAEIVDEPASLVADVKSHPALIADLDRRVRAWSGTPGRKKGSRAVVELWGELLTDWPRLLGLLGQGPGALPAGELAEAHRWISDQVWAVQDADPAEREPAQDDAAVEDEVVRDERGIDGQSTRERPVLDLYDVAVLLRAHQLLRGAKQQLSHLFVDEAQDLAPLQLAVLLGHTTPARSVTLAGDTAQRLQMHNGFSDWRHVLDQLALSHVAIEPLRVSYRSTRQILEVARYAMGSLGDAEPLQAPRTGAAVEAHRFPGTGAAVAFLAEALRSLAQREPRATVALLARHPEQADRYYEGLRRSEVPGLRRIEAQEFTFRAGVDVTEIRQVKGLEFDYVVLLDANASSFGSDDESRHLFHIGATRAAHQLWLLVTATPSPLIPTGILD